MKPHYIPQVIKNIFEIIYREYFLAIVQIGTDQRTATDNIRTYFFQNFEYLIKASHPGRTSKE